MPVYNYLEAYFKVGDQSCADGKRYSAINDGYLVDVIDRNEYNPAVTSMDLTAYAVVKLPLSWKEDLKTDLRVTGDGTEAMRARGKLVTFSELSTALGDSGLESEWRSGDVVPIQNGLELDESILKSTDILNPPVPDDNAISAGSASVGSGGTYATWVLAFADIANLTGDLTFIQVSDVTETATAAITEDLNGFTFTCTSNVHPNGDRNRGWYTEVNHDGRTVSLECEGPGNAVVEHLNFRRAVNATLASRSIVEVRSVNVSFLGTIRNNIFDGQDYVTGDLRIADSTPVMRVYGNLFVKSYRGLLVDPDDGNAESVYENNSAEGVIFAYRFNNNPGIARNLLAMDSDLAYESTSGLSVFTKCASNDSTGSEPALQDLDRDVQWAVAEIERITGALSWWKLDNSGADTKGSYNGVVTGAVGEIGFLSGTDRGLAFDGDDDNVNCGDITQLNNVSAFTFSGWLSSEDSAAVGTVLSKTIDSTHEIRLETISSTVMRVSIEDGSTAYGDFVNYTNQRPEENYHHLVLIYDGTGVTNANRLKVYIDNRQVTLAFTGTIPSATANLATADFIFGATANAFEGRLDNWRLYTTALDVTSVRDLSSQDRYQLPASGSVAISTLGVAAEYAIVLSNGASQAGTTIGAKGVLPVSTDPYAATVRRPLALVTVYWGGALLDNIRVSTGLGTSSNWLFGEIPLLANQIADEISTVPYKWFQCDNKTPLNQMRVAPGTASAAADNQVGWWGSEISDGAADFTNPQILVLETPSRLITTISVVGDDAYGEYPVDFRLQLFSGLGGGVLRYDKTVDGNGEVTWTDPAVLDFSNEAIGNATKTVLTINRWSDDDAVAKIVEFSSGPAKSVYDGDEIMSLSILEESELKDSTLPTGNISANELELSLNNVDNKFYPGNTGSSLHASVRKNRKIEVQLGLEIAETPVYIPMGTFWSGSWQTGEADPELSTAALDRMGRLRKSTFFSGLLYESQTIGALAETVLEDATLIMPDLTYTISTELYGTDYIIPFAWFKKQSHFDALKIISEAALGRVYADRTDVIRFEAPAEPGIEDLEITADNYFTRKQPEDSDDVANRVEVTTQPLIAEHSDKIYSSSEVLSLAGGEAKTYTIEYKEQPAALDVTIIAEDSGSSGFVGSVNAITYAWGADVTVFCSVSGDFKIKVSGNAYTINGAVVITETDANSQLEYGEQRFELKKNALIQTEALARTVAQKLLDSFKDPAKDVELDWRGNLAVGLDSIIRVPDYVRGTVSSKADYTIYKQKTLFDGTLRSTTNARRVRVVETVILQDTDDSGYILQDTDDSGILIYQG